MIESFSEFLETFNSLLGVNYTDVRINLSNRWGGSTSVSSRKIFIDIKGSRLSRKERAIAEAIDLHEIAHILYTPSDLFQMLREHFPVEIIVINAFEDIRIETLFAERHKSLQYILPLNLINVIQQLPNRSEPAKLRLVALLLYGRYIYGNEKAKEKLNPIIEYLSELTTINDIPSFISSYISSMNSGEIQKAAQTVWEFQKTLKPPGEPESESSSQTQPEESQTPSSGESKDTTEDSASDGENHHEDAESVLEHIQKEIASAVEALASSQESEKAVKESFIEQSRPPNIVYRKEVSPKWRKLLRTLDMESQAQGITYGRRGRKISHKHLYKILNQQYVFERKRTKSSDKGKILFLVDLSGSMFTVADDVQEMVWAVTEVLEKRHNYQVAWIYFSLLDRSFVVKRYGEAIPLPTAFNADSSTTVLSDALIIKDLLPKADLEIVISDGLLDDLKELANGSTSKDSVLLYIPTNKNIVSTKELRKLFKTVIVIDRTPDVIRGFKQIERLFK